MIYEDLRRMVLNTCTLDAIYANEGLVPYFQRLENGEGINSVLREYISKNVNLKNFTVEIDGVKYPVRINASLTGKIGSATGDAKSRGKAVRLGKTLLVCLANLRTVLTDGEKTHFVQSEHGKHYGAKWFYARDFCEEPGMRGSVIVEIKFPQPNQDPNSPTGANKVYHITAKGAKNFTHRANVVNQHLAPKGEVKVVLDT